MLPRPRLTRPQWPAPSLLRRSANVRSRFLTTTPAPKPGSGPLMTRRSDRELPSIESSRRWLRSVPIFVAIMTVSALAIFNYQKSSSSVVSSTLYALRTNKQAREILGDEIYFASKIPWIRGEMNQLHGRIDIRFWVKGTRQMALMRFRSERKTRMGAFELMEWSVQTEDGEVTDLLNAPSADPFEQTILPSTTKGQPA